MDHRTKFIFLITLQVPAVILSILVFAYFILNRVVCSKPHNHGWIVLLIINFLQLITDLPMSMNYYRIGHVSPTWRGYCVWWTWYEFSLLGIGLFMMAWVSIERHLLIFHAQSIFQVKWRRWFFHIIPILFCLLWPSVFYIIAVVISPHCSTEWDFSMVMCGFPCYFTVEFIGRFDFLFNIVMPISIVVLANITLIFRVVHKKLTLHQAFDWRRHRKMTLQLCTIGSLYMGFWLPVTIVQLIQITIMPTFMTDSVETLLFILYFIPLFLPIVSLSVFPEIIKKMIKCYQKSTTRNAVAASTYTGNRNPTMTLTVVGRN